MTATNRSFQVVAAIVVGTLLLVNVVRGERPMTFGRTTRSSRRAQSNGDCVAENDLLRDIEALYDPTDYAIYSSEESDGQEGRAFDDLVVYNDTFYDASAVGALLQPVCELYGGIFYLLELELTCGGSPHIERTPHCTGASCNRSQLVTLLVNQISERGECDVTGQEITVPDQFLADECALATSTLVAKQSGDTGSFGIGDPNYLANDVEYDDFCTEANNEGTRVCNFTSIHDDLQMRCEARKGYLYEVTEFIQSISYQDGVILSNETDYGVGYPFCIPQACDGDSFIRDVFIPTQHFYLNSTLILV